MQECVDDLVVADRIVHVRHLGIQPYQSVWQQMLQFTNERTEQHNDELWIVQHHPVYTQGTACNTSTLTPSDIPVVKTDRGGQITYHGPGQLIIYVLFELKRFDVGVKHLVNTLEQAVINLLAEYSVTAERKPGAPGVYVQGAKIAALGLRIRRGSSYHGLSLNVDMDLSPFGNIDPCGYKDLPVCQLTDIGINLPWQTLEKKLVTHFLSLLSTSSNLNGY